MEKLDLYPSKRNIFEIELKKLAKADISSRNKELITEFQNYIFSTGSGEKRVTKLSAQLRTVCRWLKGLNISSDLDKITRKEVQTLVSFINRLPDKAEATKADFRRIVKQFYLWYKEEDQRLTNRDLEAEKFYKYIEKELSISYKIAQADPNTILTEADIENVIGFARSPRDKAFLALLHETGARAGEFLNLKVGDIVVKDNYAEIHVPDGKTGRRIVYVVKSVPYLLRYMDVHPFKNNNNSYLWLSEARHNKDSPLVHIGGQDLINRCFEKAKIDKKHNWHWFRHSRATILAPKLTEVMLCKYMGWVIGSKQIKVYVHLCTKQLEDVVLAMNGIKVLEDDKDKPLKCICGSLNKHTERYCFKCYKPLKVETVIQDQELVNSEINKTVQFMMEMAKKPELMKQFEKFKEGLE